MRRRELPGSRRSTGVGQALVVLTLFSLTGAFIETGSSASFSARPVSA